MSEITKHHREVAENVINCEANRRGHLDVADVAQFLADSFPVREWIIVDNPPVKSGLYQVWVKVTSSDGSHRRQDVPYFRVSKQAWSVESTCSHGCIEVEKYSTLPPPPAKENV